jgi:hypothetical protein
MENELVNDVKYYLSTNPSLYKNLINVIDSCSKNNPYISKHEKVMWEEQCGINVPLFYLCSIYLYIYAKKNNIDTFLFATRDCCQWIKVFKKMFPDEHAVYYNCSRNMFDEAIHNGNEYFEEYTKSNIKTTPERCVFIDIHGTGRRIFTYFKKIFNVFPYYFLLSSSYRSYKDFPSITRSAYEEGKFINIVFDARGSPIEMLNYDIVGTMDTYNENGAKRCKPEYPLNLLESYHVCVDYICTKLKTQKLENISKYNVLELKELIRKIYRVIQDNKPEIANYMKHPSKHPKTIPIKNKKSSK